jgi:MoxR-like ATPase
MQHAPEDALAWARTRSADLKNAIQHVIVGQNEVIDEVLIAIFAGGHVLLEGAPGLGKTLLVKTIAACTDLTYSRIQFTPDLMPSDVTGTQVLITDGSGRAGESRFVTEKGPIFGQLVLADEINRATPKTQSSLLEAMAESAVTIAGTRHLLDDPFMVLATENPIEMEGTYPLPEAQLDRFLLKVQLENPSEDELCEVLGRTTGRDARKAAKVVSREELIQLRALCRDVAIAPPLARFVARLSRATDPAGPGATAEIKRALRYGAGVRGAQSILLAAKACALMDGRGHVAIADIARVAKPTLRHRLYRSFEAEAEGIAVDGLIDRVVKTIREAGGEEVRAIA